MESNDEVSLGDLDKSESQKGDGGLQNSKSEDEIVKEVSKEVVSSLLNLLKSKSFREVHKALSRIRSRVITSDSGISLLKECKGFKILVRYLSVKNEDMLNIVLSILGNCCNIIVGDQDLRDEVLKNGVAQEVIGVLKRVGTNNGSEALLRRALRLVGNLAQARNIGIALHKAEAVNVIINILKTSNDQQVKQMSIRALRWLWETDKYQGEMLKAQVVFTVASLLWTDDPEMLPMVLRALVVFTQPCSPRVAEQMKGEGGLGYARIVTLMENKSTTNVIVCNLSTSPIARVELAKAAVIPAILKILDTGKNINSYLITAICVMCQESMVRANLRTDPRGFPTLLTLLGDHRVKQFHPELLAAITQFNYDQQSLMMMVSGGLINLLVSKLGELSGDCHEEEERVGGSGTSAEGFPFCSSPPLLPSLSPTLVPSFSPPLTPSSSPPSSSSSCLTFSSPSHPLYSPSCSPNYEDPTSLTDDSFNQVEKSCLCGDLSMEGCILEIISQLTYQNVPLPPLASKTTITTFLDFISTLSLPRYIYNYKKAIKVLGAIVSCKHYYNSLLDEESILEVHRKLCRPRHSNCDWCNRLGITGKWVLGEAGLAAQSGLGEGEMLTRLAAGPHPITALTIPLVVKQAGLLYSLLLCHNGLQCLLDTLDTRIEEAVPSLYELFSTLSILDPRKTVKLCTSCDIGSSRKEGNVTFQLDDGSTVSGNKESLSHNCPMFEAMFRGGFKEATQTTIRLSGISSDCLSHLIRLADEYCSCILPKELGTLLEVIVAADRFLLPDLCQSVLSHVVNSALSPSTAASAYDWGLHVGLEIAESVPRHVVKYLLASEMRTPDRVAAIAPILSGRNKSSFLSDLKSLAVEFLKEYKRQPKFDFKNDSNYFKKYHLC